MVLYLPTGKDYLRKKDDFMAKKKETLEEKTRANWI